MERGNIRGGPVVLPPAGAGRGVLRSCFGLSAAGLLLCSAAGLLLCTGTGSSNALACRCPCIYIVVNS